MKSLKTITEVTIFSDQFIFITFSKVATKTFFKTFICRNNLLQNYISSILDEKYEFCQLCLNSWLVVYIECRQKYREFFFFFN